LIEFIFSLLKERAINYSPEQKPFSDPYPERRIDLCKYRIYRVEKYGSATTLNLIQTKYSFKLSSSWVRLP